MRKTVPARTKQYLRCWCNREGILEEGVGHKDWANNLESFCRSMKGG